MKRIITLGIPLISILIIFIYRLIKGEVNFDLTDASDKNVAIFLGLATLIFSFLTLKNNLVSRRLNLLNMQKQSVDESYDKIKSKTKFQEQIYQAYLYYITIATDRPIPSYFLSNWGDCLVIKLRKVKYIKYIFRDQTKIEKRISGVISLKILRYIQMILQHI